MGKLVNLVFTSGAMKALAPPGQVKGAEGKGAEGKVVELETTDNSDSEKGVLDSGRDILVMVWSVIDSPF
jgi:hypothetical protein